MAVTHHAVARGGEIGVLGGMGPRATHYFVGELLRAFESAVGPARDQDYPNVFVHYACSNPDRTQAMLGDDPEGLRKILLRQLWTLARRGCDRIVIPCMSAHVVLDPIPVGLPVLDLRDATFDHLASELKVSEAVGLLGTRATNMAVVKGARSVVAGTAVRVLQGDHEQALMSVIYRDLKSGAWGEAVAEKLLDLCAVLRDAGAAHVIAGCTEVEMCLAASGRCPSHVVFPLQVAARLLATRIGTWPPAPVAPDVDSCALRIEGCDERSRFHGRRANA